MGWGWSQRLDPPVLSPMDWLFHLNDTCEANLVWSVRRWGLLGRLTKEGWSCQVELDSGRLEEPPLSSAPVIKCRIKEEALLPTLPAPQPRLIRPIHKAPSKKY